MLILNNLKLANSLAYTNVISVCYRSKSTKATSMRSYARFRLGAFTNKNVNVMSLRNKGRSLINMLRSIMLISGLPYTSGRIRTLIHITRFISFLVETQGPRGATLYLKGCAVYLQQAIGLHVIKDCKAFGPGISRTTDGLPRIIPVLHREMIRAGNPKIIKFYLSVFNIYRCFDWLGPVKLGTITAPFKGTNKIDLTIYHEAFLSAIPNTNYLEWRTLLQERYDNFKLFDMFKSGPQTNDVQNINTHPIVVAGSARMLAKNPKLDLASSYFAGKCSNRLQEVFSWFKVNIPDHVGMHSHELHQLEGKLGLKQEAAGKIRVFAMVDAWTQWFLRPLHDVIFSVLRGIPQDGTFNQLAPVHRLLKRGLVLSSLDLSAATDRLPVSTQIELLSAAFGSEFAQMWGIILTERTYHAYNKDLLPKGKDLRYAVGQPMGALSSWSMLALVHHFIIQCAAWRSGIIPVGQWYTNYAVLGDDVVIGDTEVAKAYLEILESLGVECGLHKSLLAQRVNTLEFAKRTFFNGVDVSPIPIAELRAASLSISAAKELATKYGLSLTLLIKAFGYGYKVLARLSAPMNKLNSNIKDIKLNSCAPTKMSEVLPFFKLGLTRAGATLRVGASSPGISGDIHSFYKNKEYLTARPIKEVFIENNVKPFSLALHRLISELRTEVSLIKRVRQFSHELWGYYRGVGLDMDPKTIANKIMFIWNGTHAGPNQKARIGIMRLKKDLEFMIANPDLFSFEEMYWDIYLMKKELALLPLDMVRFIRSVDPELMLSKPYHVRQWKALIGYITGTTAFPNKPPKGEFKEMPIVPGGGTNPNPLFLMAESLGLW